ncbi:lig_chan-Glu_bd domain-containing protein [Caerostris darwini]|uniref:Lig_chan-Glu_bd domain-containing protein n=1 Tax=Caerostris darwini TaxID=1538125 RepID=A0AAV4PR58_9ARAC|nr:lig_chan-Glu_bd domain-containing protein [Caerostris darwini]
MPLRHVLEIKVDSKGTIRLIRGLEANLINFLSSRLGFEYQLFLPEDKAWGRFENGKWTGMVGMILRNETDIALGDLTISEKRFQVIDFIPFAVESTSFVTKIHKQIVLKPTSFLTPYHWQVWLTVGLLVIIMPFLFRLLMVKKVPMTDLFLSMIGCLFMQPVAFTSESVRDKLLIGSWILSMVLTSFSYTALLLSSLTVPLQDHGIRTIKDLASAVSSGKFKVAINRGSTHKDILTSSINEDLQKISTHIVEEEYFSIEDGMIMPADIDDNIAILGPTWYFMLQYGEPPLSNKYVFKESIGTGNIGMAMSKGFCCKRNLTTHISWVLNSGIFRKWYDEQFYKTRSEHQAKGNIINRGPKPLTVFDLLGPFFLLGVGCTLGFLICVLGIVKYKISKWIR